MTMPALGESVTEGTVTRWLKSEGDEVAVDEPLLEVSTDKVDTEIPSPVAGTLTKILVQEDDTVPVGADLAVIGGSAPAAAVRARAREGPRARAGRARAPEGAGAERAAAPAAPKAPAQATSEEATQEAAGKPADAERAPAQQSPRGDRTGRRGTVARRRRRLRHAARAQAREPARRRPRRRSPAPASAAASASRTCSTRPRPPRPRPSRPRQPAGRLRRPGGRCRVCRTGATASVSPKRGTREKMTRLRKVIATPHGRVAAGLGPADDRRRGRPDQGRAAARPRSRATSRPARGHQAQLPAVLRARRRRGPQGAPDGQREHRGRRGRSTTAARTSRIAVDTEKGLIVPVVKNAGDLNIAGLARAIADVAARTRSNKITPDDLAGGTFTITNTGSRGALFDTPIINQPQVAILGTGAIVKRPVVVTDADGGETIAIRSMMYLALSYDHRIVDGADAARFLGTMKARLEEGQFEA